LSLTVAHLSLTSTKDTGVEDEDGDIGQEDSWAVISAYFDEKVPTTAHYLALSLSLTHTTSNV
jgi:hypothetical protein